MTQGRLSALVSACGLAAGVASAQPVQVNISGATLLSTFLTSQASTNDFLNIDGSGPAIGDQLAPQPATNLGNPNHVLLITYTEVGSGNGIADLDRAGSANPAGFVVGSQSMPTGGSLSSVAEGTANRAEFITGGNLTGLGNAANPRGYPARQLMDGSYLASASTDDMVAGIQIDLAPTDVPIQWFITQSGSGLFDAAPGSAGYGANPISSVDRFDGTPGAQSNELKTLDNTAVAGSANPGALPEIYGTSLTSAPVSYLVNYGTGVSEIDQSALRFGFISGRLPTGENLAFHTRDSGSGTRNAAMNGICLDPSYGMGDNYGPKASNSSTDLIGPNFQGTNKGGSSRMDASVINNRLAIGYTGAERVSNRGYFGDPESLGDNELDVLGIRFDVYDAGATSFNRPTISNIINNAPGMGYHVIAPSSIGSIGDPRSSLNTDINDFDGDSNTAESIPGTDPLNTNPAVANRGAAAYLNNITASIAAFANDQGDDATLFSPGEFLALNFVPAGTTNFIDGPNGACDLIANPNVNADLQFVVEQLSILADSDYAAFDGTSAGLVPTRTVGDLNGDMVVNATDVYSDGVALNYVTANGTALSYGSAINAENKIAFDFNTDGVRDINDAAALVEAFDARYNGGTWTGNGLVSFELIGDANGDGNFDIVDVRTAADGLLVQAGSRVMDRAAAYAAVDAAAGGNFFGTTLVTGSAYSANSGWSRADIVGNGNAPTPGYHLNAADGVIDGQDIDYIAKQFADLADGEFNWADSIDASTPAFDGTRRDFSGDMNGDLVVNADDAIAVLGWLGTSQGDVDLDGDIDADDTAIITANLGATNALYTGGDVNFDGVVDNNDLNFGGRLCADVNNDGVINGLDFGAWLNAFNANSPLADANQDGVINGLDFGAWLGAFNAGAAGPICNP